jgi:hypothetical protein
MKKIMLTLLLAVVTFSAYADAKKEGNNHFQEFAKRQEKAIIDEALLSEKQVEAFMPIYREYKKSLFELGRQKFELKKNSRENFGAVLSQLADIEKKEAEVKKNFYEKGANAITAEKMFRVIRAEDRFHHNMLKNGMRQQNRNNWNKNHRGPGKEKKQGGAKPSSPDSKGRPSR